MKKIYKEKIFINNKFNYKKFEFYVEQNRDYDYLQNNIDSIVTVDNCTDENIILIKSHFDKFDNDKKSKNKTNDHISLLISFASIVFSFMSIDSYKNNKIIEDNTITNQIIFKFLFIALPILLASCIFIILRWILRNDDSYKTFAYTYLIRKMELIKESKR